MTIQYGAGDDVILWMGRVTPKANRYNQRNYFTTPLCRGPVEVIPYDGPLGDLEHSGLSILFRGRPQRRVYCEIDLDVGNNRATLTDAIKNDFVVEMFIDGIPFHESIGVYNAEKNSSLMFTHRNFRIGFRKGLIIQVSVSVGGLVNLDDVQKIFMSYEVDWFHSDLEFERSFLESALVNQRIRQLVTAIGVTFVGVLLLIIMATLIKNCTDKTKVSAANSQSYNNVFIHEKLEI